MTITDLITDLEFKISALNSDIEVDAYNGVSSPAKFAQLHSFEYCLGKLKEIKDS